MAMHTLRLVERRPIECLIGFLDDLFEVRRQNGNKKMWYRGHADPRYQLVPSIGREQVYAGRRQLLRAGLEWELLHRFRRRTYLEFGRLLTAGEALFVARHHRLPTRLLDWTANALFGLYFACGGDAAGGGTVWALKRRDRPVQLNSLKLARCEDERTLFAILDGHYARAPRGRRPPRFKIVEPLYNSPRLRAQDGAFTIHDAPRRPLEEYVGRRFTHANLDVDALFRWGIRPGRKRQLLEELSGLGITDRLVYPDLDGIARSLTETEVLWTRH